MLTYLLGRTAPVKIIVCSFGANDYFTGSDGDPPDTDRWTVDLAGSGICEINTNQLEMFSDPYTSTATLTHNAVFTGYNSIQIDYDLGSSSTKQSVNFYIEVENQSNSYWVRFYKGYTLPTPRVYVDKDDGSTSTIFSDTSNDYSTGTVKFVRSGNAMTVWLDSGSGFVSLATMSDFGSGSIQYKIHFPLTAFAINTFYFDNFIINSGTMDCS